MRAILLLTILMPLAAQDTPPPAATAVKKPAAEQTATPPTPAKDAIKAGPTTQTKTGEPPAADAKQPEATSPVPATESWFTGTVDLGYRWRTDVGGSFDTYRSIVNLGSGPKLLGAEFTVSDPKHKLFDRIDVRAYSWGDDPYGTLHIHANKSSLYDFNADYRDIAYFNFLPSYADPLLLARGVILNQQSFDLRRRFAGFHLDLLPGRWLIPYVAYDRDSQSGTGVTTFVGDGNQYPVPNRLHDTTNLYRGGVRLELRRVHATLEQGGTTFKDDQNVYQNGGAKNPGYPTAPVQGQLLNLSSLLAAYDVTGDSIYSKGLLTASATSWLDLYGQFLYSQPDSTVNYQQTAAGTFFLPSQFLLYNNQQFLLSAESKMPHTTGSAGAEIRPLHNVRILQSWLTDRLHSAGAAASTQLLAGPGFSQQSAAQLTALLITNYNQAETTVIWDAFSRLTLRGGYRRVWGDAADATLPTRLAGPDEGKLRRNVAIGGFTFRPLRKLTVTAEGEGASDDSAYFRISLHDYQKARAQVRYQAMAALNISADFTLLNNQNNAPGVNYDYRARQESLSFLWSPAAGKVFDLQGSYSRSALYSNIGFLTPQDLQPQRSLYRDNSHTATALLNVNLPHAGAFAPKITAGGSFFISSGSRASSFYQPYGRLWIPTGKKLNWFADWRYYGYGEASYLYEAFRAHVVTAGVRITP